MKVEILGGGESEAANFLEFWHIHIQSCNDYVFGSMNLFLDILWFNSDPHWPGPKEKYSEERHKGGIKITHCGNTAREKPILLMFLAMSGKYLLVFFARQNWR